MNLSKRFETLLADLGQQFAVTEQNGRFRVRTPYLYPDGEVIDIFCKPTENGDELIVTDFAETTNWLSMHSLSQRRSYKQNYLIQDTCVTHGVEFYREMLLARCRSGDSLAETITKVAHASIRISDLWFTFRTRAVSSISDEVADFMDEKKINFSRSKNIEGKSGKFWNVDFSVNTESQKSLIQILATESTAATRRIVEHTIAGWYDIRHLANGESKQQFISLFDDNTDIWKPEDFNLVEDLSVVSLWSNPDQFISVLSS